MLWFYTREPFARGLALALLVVAALGIGVGGTVYFRSDAQARQLVELHAADPARFASEEGPRISKVVRSFATYRLAYVAATLIALGLVFVFGRPWHHGFAVGLLLLAALGFTIDITPSVAPSSTSRRSCGTGGSKPRANGRCGHCVLAATAFRLA